MVSLSTVKLLDTKSYYEKLPSLEEKDRKRKIKYRVRE
jgi:hypothetical protein